MLSKRILVLMFVVAFLFVGCLPGVTPPITPPTPEGISGRVMVPDPGFTKDITGWIPVANATVTLTDFKGVIHTVTTDEDGYYTFTGVAAVEANTIITATATVNGNIVIVKDVIPKVLAAGGDYDAGTADAESTALALIVEELLEQGFYLGAIDLEEIQDSANFTEVVGQVTTVLEENGNVTTDPGLTNTVGNVAEDIISPPTPSEEPTEPDYVPTPTPTVELTGIEASPETMTLLFEETQLLTVIANYSDGSIDSVTADCTYLSSNEDIAEVDAGSVTAFGFGKTTILIAYTPDGIAIIDTVEVIVGPVRNATSGFRYDTIKAAITGAGDGDTIEVAAGTYEEDLNISTTDLTLESTDGRDVTTILCAGSDDIVLVTASGVTIEGFTIQGLKATVPARNGIDLRGSGFTIQNNKFVDIYYDNIMVSDQGGEADIISGTITNNTFTGMGTDAGRGAIWLESYNSNISGITISNNIVSGYGGTNLSTITVAMTFAGTGTVSDITVTGNSVTDGTYGLSLYNGGTAATPTMDTISVTDNTFSGCVIGIMSWPAADNDPTNVTITGNDITDNIEVGILIESWDTTNAINDNNIVGNMVYGIQNVVPVIVDATDNWWGDPGGPGKDFDTDGVSGDTVSGDVDYSNQSIVPN